MQLNYSQLYDLYIIAYKNGYNNSFSKWIKENYESNSQKATVINGGDMIHGKMVHLSFKPCLKSCQEESWKVCVNYI